MNPTHFQLDFQIMHYEDILRYRTGSHMILYGYSTGSHLTGSFILLRVACYYSVSNNRFSFALVMVNIVQMDYVNPKQGRFVCDLPSSKCSHFRLFHVAKNTG